MRKVLGQKFFDRSTLVVAKDLLGKYLVRKIGKKEIALMIVETEAYDGPKDLACHARSGKTKRNYPMFGEAGRAYVYFTYGMHWMLNLVTGKKDYPAAVLIRGLSHQGLTLIKQNSSKKPYKSTHTLQGLTLKLDGPAKLTKYLKIDVKLNNQKLGKGSGLWVEDRGVKISPRQIKRTPRIGVSYAGSYAKKPWRFYLSG